MISIFLTLFLYGNIYSSSENLYLIGYQNGEPISTLVSRVPGKDKWDRPLYLTLPAANAYNSMLEAAVQDGIFLQLVHAFRDLQTQKHLKKRLRSRAAQPGYSLHQAGLAIDIGNCTIKINNKRVKTNTYHWLREYAHEFGFYQPLQREYWHWEYRENKS